MEVHKNSRTGMDKYNGKDKSKDDTSKGLDDVYQAQKRNESAIAALARQRYENEAQVNKQIYEDVTQSLDARLDAYKKYQQDQIMLATIENAAEVATIQDKIHSLNEKQKAYSDGTISLNKYQLQALKLDQDTYNKELIAAQQSLQTKLNQITAQGIVQAQAIRNSDKEQNIKAQKEFIAESTTAMESLLDQDASMYNKEAAEIADAYLNRQINEKQFQEQMKKLRNDYAIIELTERIANDEWLLQQDNVTGERRLEIIRRLNKERKQLTDEETTGAAATKPKNSLLASWGVSESDYATAQQFATSIISFNDEIIKSIDQRYQKEIDALEAKRKLIDDNSQAEIDAINSSAISQADKDKKIAAVKAQAAQQDKILQQQEVAYKRKQAIADKENSIAQIIEKTAVAVISSFTYDPTGILAAIIAAVGAVQLGRAIAAPLPQYADGTDFHPGGDAIIGEMYKPEMVIEPGKAPYVLDRPTLVKNLARGAKVITQQELVSNMAGHMGFMSPALLAQTAVPANDYSALQQTIREDGAATRAATKEALQNIPQTRLVMRNGEWVRSVSIGSSKTTFVNKGNS